MKICGYNEFSQLGPPPNTKNDDEKLTTSPPINSNFEISSFLSFSLYYDHAIWITKDGDAYAVGDNRDFVIIHSLPAKIFDKKQKIIINDKEGHPFKFLSALSGGYYSLYLVSNGPTNNDKHLVYSYADEDIDGKVNRSDIFLNLNGRVPIALFGGGQSSAAIDTEGGIIIITKSIYSNPSQIVEATFLPNSEKAVNVACCNNSLIALSSEGHIFKATNLTDKKVTFTQIYDLISQVNEISGTFMHCIAVCSDGKVFASGGFGHNNKPDKFVEVKELNKENITSCYAGDCHTLFLSSKGEVFACGLNDCGQLFTKDLETYEFDEPFKTDVKNASFCFAGGHLSAAIIGMQPPPLTPNRRVTNQECIQKDICIEMLRKENENLKKKIKSISKSENNFEILGADFIHNLKIIHEISSGASGKVLEVAKEERLALKVMHTGEYDNKKLQNFIKEYEIISRLNHPNVIKAFGIFLSDKTSPPSILLELCLKDLLTEIKAKKFSSVDFVFWIYQIVEGMRYVHFRGFIHRDLKPSNILFGKDGLIRISDFGISKLMSSEEQMTTLGIGTQKFMAPEILKEEKYNEKVDVYSFGVVLYFMLSFGELPKINIIDVGTGKKAEIPSSFNNFAKSLINSCWEYKAGNRPSFNDILSLLEKNDYKILDLNESEVSKLRNLIISHKSILPDY